MTKIDPVAKLLARSVKIATKNALAMLDECYNETAGTFDYVMLSNELIRRNGGKTLPAKTSETLRKMVDAYLSCKVVQS